MFYKKANVAERAMNVGDLVVVTLLLLDACHFVRASTEESLFCPEGCLCPREEEVMCDGVDFRSIPQQMSPRLRNLTISRASIEQIGRDDFRFYGELERLSLSHCGLERIEEYTFGQLSNLQYLALLHNPLSELGSYALGGLRNLKELILRAEHLRQIAAFTFFGSETIRGLDLRSSSIRSIDTDAFNGLRGVQFLHLPVNLQLINANAFKNLTRVHFIDIRQWHANESSLAGVGRDTFRGLSHVSSIRIDQSNLGTIHSGAFDHLETVETVQVINSRVDSVRSAAFAKMRNVGKLEFLNNEIGHVARHAFLNVPGEDVYQLSMVDNDLDCSCRNGWLVHNFEQLPEAIKRRNYCSSPKQLDKRALQSIEMDHLHSCRQLYNYHHLDEESSRSTCTRSAAAMSALTLVLVWLLS